MLKNSFQKVPILPLLVSIFCLELLLISSIPIAQSHVTSNIDSPFGVSGVRYPNGLRGPKQTSPVSLLTKSTHTSWVRGSTLVWGHLETAKGHYNWGHFDTVISQCQADNIQLLINIAPFAEWDQGKKRGKPTDMPAFLTFLKKFVERYDFDGIDDMPGLQYGMHYFEILNEPMAVGHFFDGDVNDFFDIYKQSYPVIKKASPQAKLLIAGLADIEDHAIRGLPPTFSAHPLTKKYIKTFHTYYDLLHKLGIEDFYDIMNLHIYDSDLSTVVRYYQKFDKPIWITEISESNKEGETNQSQMLIKRFVKSLALGVNKIFWFSLSNDRHMLHSGLFNNNKEPRKTFFAYRMMVDKLHDTEWQQVRVIPTSHSKLHCYAFPRKNSNKTVWVAWADRNHKMEVLLNLETLSQDVTVTPLQNSQPMKKNSQSHYHFDKQVISTEQGKILIKLDSTPIFIEENIQPAYIITVNPVNTKFSPENNRHFGKQKKSSFQRSLPAQHKTGPFFGKITAIDGHKISFSSQMTQNIIVYTDRDTTITQNRYESIKLDRFNQGDEVVIILRQSEGKGAKQFISILDKLPRRQK